jgi:DNA polymerase I-like protein with 3'-5' exonuclease and polymerase domains
MSTKSNPQPPSKLKPTALQNSSAKEIKRRLQSYLHGDLLSQKPTIFDIETNDLWPHVNKTWLIQVIDPETGDEDAYTDYDPKLPSKTKGLKRLSREERLAGHNICGFDIPVLEYLEDWTPKPEVRLLDTYLMSVVLRYKRPHRHSLEGWGLHLGDPKGDFKDFDKYSRRMLKYGMQDVRLNVKILEKLWKEFESTARINPLIEKSMEVEMRFALIEAAIRYRGWDFDHDKAAKLLEHLQVRHDKLERRLNKQIGLVCIRRDKKPTMPKFNLNGKLSIVSARWFLKEHGGPYDSLEQIQKKRILRPGAPYSRVSFEPGKASSDKHLKAWLYSLGWEPDDWNKERLPNGQTIQKSPKLTESSLKALGPIGEKVIEYNTVASRYGILKGWLKAVEYDGRLHGSMRTVGTPTFRCTHNVVANIPTLDSEYGKEMRELLLPAEPGTLGYKKWVIVGADSSGNQMRGFCHLIGNAEFTREVLSGDIHTKNANLLREFMLDWAHDESDWSTKDTCPFDPRDRSKKFLYSYLFGAGAAKSAEIINKKRDIELGKAAQEAFMGSIPGLKKHREEIKSTWEKTKRKYGYEWAHIRSIDGRLLFVESAHTLLTAELQSIEALTCKAAAVYLDYVLKEKEIPFFWLLHYHDELAVTCPEEYREEVMMLSREAFREAPKTFGVMIMDGEAKSGDSYADVH